MLSWLYTLNPARLYVLSSGWIDEARWQSTLIGISICQECSPLSMTILENCFDLPLLLILSAEHLFCSTRHSNYEALLIHIVCVATLNRVLGDLTTVD